MGKGRILLQAMHLLFAAIIFFDAVRIKKDICGQAGLIVIPSKRGNSENVTPVVFETHVTVKWHKISDG